MWPETPDGARRFADATKLPQFQESADENRRGSPAWVRAILDEDARHEGLRIRVEAIRALRAMQGVASVHSMGHRHEEPVPEILRDAGLRDHGTAFATRAVILRLRRAQSRPGQVRSVQFFQSEVGDD